MFNKYSTFIVSIVIILLFTINPLDRTPLEKSDYYKNTIESIDSKEIKSISGDTIRVGWSKASLIPPYSTPMAGYGARKGAHFEGVNDSIWVKAVVFDNGISKSAYVSLDLLIVPPNLDHNKITEGLGIESENILFTASHTHSSIGGYLEGLAGNLFGGKYEQKNIDFITSSIRKALEGALRDTHKSMMLGTAGFTALLCSFAVKAKEELLLGEKIKDVLVTGATGGVGSIAVMILSKMGYDVHAVTGKKDKNDYLKNLGAKK